MTNKLPASLLRSSVVARCTNMHRLARVRGVETTTRSRNLPTARPTTIPNDVVVIVVVHRKQKDEEWMPIHRENSSVLALDRPRRTRFTLTFQCPQETTTPSAMDAPARHDVWNESEAMIHRPSHSFASNCCQNASREWYDKWQLVDFGWFLVAMRSIAL
jgi:hypothetical protein